MLNKKDSLEEKEESKSIRELSRLVEGRREIYKFLSSLFRTSPKKGIIEILVNSDLLEEIRSILGNDSIVCLEAFKEKFNGNYEELEHEYQNLFAIPLSKYVTPYEAVYRDERTVGHRRVRGLLMGPSTVDVKKFYDKAGADIGSIKELPDHIGVELEFLHFLCSREEELWRNGDEEGASSMVNYEKKFLEEHLCQWIGEICDNISEKTSSDFYRGIARITLDFVESDYNTLKDLIHQNNRG